MGLLPGWAHSKSTVQLKGSGSSQSGAIYDVWVKDYRFYRDVVQCVAFFLCPILLLRSFLRSFGLVLFYDVAQWPVDCARPADNTPCACAG
jgi:hypothetical protein